MNRCIAVKTRKNIGRAILYALLLSVIPLKFKKDSASEPEDLAE